MESVSSSSRQQQVKTPSPPLPPLPKSSTLSSSINPVKIVSQLKMQLVRTITIARACSSSRSGSSSSSSSGSGSVHKCSDITSLRSNMIALEQSLESLRDLMCGNFFVESIAGENSGADSACAQFQLERELADDENGGDVIGYAIANIDALRASPRALRHAQQIISHVLIAYAYQTSRPLTQFLLSHEFLLATLAANLRASRRDASDSVLFVCADLLAQCCAHNGLARKLIDLIDDDDDDDDEKENEKAEEKDKSKQRMKSMPKPKDDNKAEEKITKTTKKLDDVKEVKEDKIDDDDFDRHYHDDYNENDDDFTDPADDSGLQHRQRRPIYIRLLNGAVRCTNPARISAIFRFITALLTSHEEVIRYAIDRDAYPLIRVFNRLMFDDRAHYFTRFKALHLFARLIQNRKLLPLLFAYTGDIQNLNRFFAWIRTLQSADCDGGGNRRKQEHIWVFEVFRLFLLNPANERREQFKRFAADQYMTVMTVIEKAEKVRSYSDLALLYAEYGDVRERFSTMADVQTGDDSDKSGSGKRSGKGRRRLAATGYFGSNESL